MKNIVYLSLMLLSLESAAQTTIYPYSDGHRWGLTNANREIIAQPQFDTSVFFDNEPYGIAVKNKKYGTIGRDGKTQIDFTYDYISSYREGFGRGYIIGNGYTKEGYSVKKTFILNLKTGKVISNESFDDFGQYCYCKDKLLLVIKSDSMFFVSGITGKRQGKATYERAEFLPEQGDGAKAIVKTGGKYGVLDAKTGAWIVPAKYDDASQTFHNNQIAIRVTANGQKSYLDYNGKPIQEQKPKAGGMEEEGVAVMDVVSPVVDEGWAGKDIYVYNQGNSNWKLGLESRGSGNTKVHQTFEIKGYADVEKISFYDEQNKVPALIKAVKDGKTGIIGLKGEVLVPFIYDNIEPVKFHSFYLQVTLNNKIGILKRDLTELSKPVLKQVMREEYHFRAWYVEMPNGFRGFMDSNTGKIYIPGAE